MTSGRNVGFLAGALVAALLVGSAGISMLRKEPAQLTAQALCNAACSNSALQNRSGCAQDWEPVYHFDLNISNARSIDVFSNCLAINDGGFLDFYDASDTGNVNMSLSMKPAGMTDIQGVLYEDRGDFKFTKHKDHYFYLVGSDGIHLYMHDPFTRIFGKEAFSGWTGTGTRVDGGLFMHWKSEAAQKFDDGYIYAANTGIGKEIEGVRLKHNWKPMNAGMKDIAGGRRVTVDGIAFNGDFAYVSLHQSSGFPAQIRVYRIGDNGGLLGETCGICPADVQCAGGKTCSVSGAKCEEGLADSCTVDADCGDNMYCEPETGKCGHRCGNGVLDPGENCANCKIDAGCPAGKCCDPDTRECSDDQDACGCMGKTCPDGYSCMEESMECVRTCGDGFRQGYVSSIAHSNFFADGGEIAVNDNHLFAVRIESSNLSLEGSDVVKMHVYSLADPAYPEEVSEFAIGSYAGLGGGTKLSVKSIGGKVISVNGTLVDVSDPLKPGVIEGDYKKSRLLAARDGYLYVLYDGDVYVYDINGCADNVLSGGGALCPAVLSDNPVSEEDAEELWSDADLIAELLDAMKKAGEAKTKEFKQYLKDKADARSAYISARDAAVSAYKQSALMAFDAYRNERLSAMGDYVQARQDATADYKNAIQNEYQDALGAKGDYLSAKAVHDACVETSGSSACLPEEAVMESARTNLINKINIYKSARVAAKANYLASMNGAKDDYLLSISTAKQTYSDAKEQSKQDYLAAKAAVKSQYEADVAAAWARYIPFRDAYLTAKANYLAAVNGQLD